MAVTTERLVMLIEARNHDVLKKLNQVERQFQKTATTGESSVAKLNNTMKRSAANAQQFGGAFSGIGAQFQDIGVSIAGGMNPGLVALQQGTQIAGQMQMAMQRGASATQVLRTAFASLVSPVALVSIAATAIAGIGLQYLFGAWSDEADEAADSVKILSKSMERLREVGVEVSEIDLGDFLSFSQVTRRVEVELDRLRSLADGARADIVKQFASEGSLIGGATVFDQLIDAADEAYDILDRTGNRARKSLIFGIKAAAEQFDAAKISAEDFEAIVARNISQLRELGVSIPSETVDTLLRMTDSAVGLQRQIEKITLAQAEKEAQAVLRKLEAMERTWRANVLVNFSMSGEVNKISQLLDAIGAPKDLVGAAFAREKSAATLEGAYGAAAQGRSAPNVENLSAQYALRDQAMSSAQKASKRGQSSYEKEREQVQKVIEALRLEQQQIGMTAEQKRVMNELRAAGSAATDTERQMIEDLVIGNERATARMEALTQATEFFQDQAMSAFSSVISQIDTGNAVLDRFLQTLIEATMQASLLGKGPLAGIFGDGGGGLPFLGGLGSLFGGFFANGGNLGAGKWGIAGENGPEIIKGPATVVPMRANDNRGGSPVYINIDATGADAAGLARVEAQLSEIKRTFGKNAVAAVGQQRSRGVV